MGVASNGHCFSTAELAAAHACGASWPVAGVHSGGGSVVVECAGTDGVTFTLHRYVDGGAPVAQLVTFAGPACEELEWITYSPFSLSAADGALIGSAVAAVWLAAWGWKAVYRTLRGPVDDYE